MRALGPLALAVLVMLPRLTSAQFGLLDDGLTVQTGREVHGRWASVLHLIPETGRFFPAYWLTYSVIWSVVGTRPLAFFVVNAAVLASLLAMLAHLVRLAGDTRVAVTIAAVAFALSGPAVESFYTLSKAEPLQLAWIALSLLCTATAAARVRGSLGRAGWTAGAGVALLFAHATKETSVVLAPIALGWLVIERRAKPGHPCAARFAASYLGVAIVSAAAFAVLRWRYAALPLGEGWYTRAYAFDAATVGPALFRIMAWLVRDFAFLLPLVAVGLVRDRTRGPLLYASIWMLGWLAVYLPWPATFEYYLLPFTLGAAWVAGIVVGDLWRDRAVTPLAWPTLTACALLWVSAGINAAADARVQLVVDRANGQLVDVLGGLPRDSRVALNMSPINEYHFELPMHLVEMKRRPDIAFARPTTAPGHQGETFLVTPEMANPPRPTVRIALHEAAVRQDRAMLDGLIASGAAERVYETTQRVGILEFGIGRLLCRVAVAPILDPTYCPTERGLIERRTFTYGWQVHRLVHARPIAATMRHGG